MESSIELLYLLVVGASIFWLIGGAVGYLIGLWKASKIYEKFINYIGNEFMENIKNEMKK